MIAGLGGLYYVMDYACVSVEINALRPRLGCDCPRHIYVWRPNVSIFASFLFGGLYILHVFIPSVANLAIKELYKMAPYIVTIIVLIAVSIREKRESQPPASLGLAYFREDR